MKFKNSQEAFEKLYNNISKNGIDYSGTKCLHNIGFEIQNPLNNLINTKWRNWKPDYAELEWNWYLSENPNAIEIAKSAKIWNKCMDINGNVNSNYGWQWSRGKQLDYIVNELKTNKESRRASISIYDAKNRYNFENDTPCTYAINFYILNNKLNMSVMMRSNDLWYGFCNDQYCFSKLQEMISNKLKIKIGSYYHFVNNIHIYNAFLNKKLN
jgi:thymidylate synthase